MMNIVNGCTDAFEIEEKKSEFLDCYKRREYQERHIVNITKRKIVHIILKIKYFGKIIFRSAYKI